VARCSDSVLEAGNRYYYLILFGFLFAGDARSCFTGIDCQAIDAGTRLTRVKYCVATATRLWKARSAPWKVRSA
jgi:hypothetical protein